MLCFFLCLQISSIFVPFCLEQILSHTINSGLYGTIVLNTRGLNQVGKNELAKLVQWVSVGTCIYKELKLLSVTGVMEQRSIRVKPLTGAAAAASMHAAFTRWLISSDRVS